LTPNPAQHLGVFDVAGLLAATVPPAWSCTVQLTRPSIAHDGVFERSLLRGGANANAGCWGSPLAFPPVGHEDGLGRREGGRTGAHGIVLTALDLVLVSCGLTGGSCPWLRPEVTRVARGASDLERHLVVFLVRAERTGSPYWTSWARLSASL
jgi:hypothetical protein